MTTTQYIRLELLSAGSKKNLKCCEGKRHRANDYPSALAETRLEPIHDTAYDRVRNNIKQAAQCENAADYRRAKAHLL